MKTILVIYTNIKLSKKDSQTSKRYAFNVKTKVKLGDLYSCERYTTKIQVVEIFSTCYKYVDISNGELSNKRKASTMQYEIRELNTKRKEESSALDCFLEEDCF